MRFISLAGHTHSSGSRVRLGASVPWPWGTSGPADPPPEVHAGPEASAENLEQDERTMVFGKRAEEVGEAIAHAQAVLDLAEFSKADLSSSIRLVANARDALARKEYDAAQALAGRAETLASSLGERYRSAQKALNALLAIAKKAREVGFQSAELDGAIAEARRVAREGTVENGVSIPNYLQARTLLESATTRGTDLLKRAEGVANEIFTADLALDALKDANGHSDHEEFERLVLAGGRALLEGAKTAMAGGDRGAAGP